MAKVRTEKELGAAIKNREDTIEIEGDLAKKAIRIKATGNVAWVIAIGSIGVAVYAIIAAPATGGTSAAISAIAAPAAVGVLGGSTTLAAISIAVAGGGVATLTKLREYKIESKSENRVVLRRM